MAKTKTKGRETKEKEKAIDLALMQIEKDFGKGAIMKLGDSRHMEGDISFVLPNIWKGGHFCELRMRPL